MKSATPKPPPAQVWVLYCSACGVVIRVERGRPVLLADRCPACLAPKESIQSASYAPVGKAGA
jgi:hypothetical protein